MKKAYQYIRISQKDQSNWSIEGQRDLINKYAERHGIEVVKTFIDDGKSARDFNRPDWKKLESEISKNRHTVDFLIIAKFDRLIRNTLQGLQQLEKLENKWNVQVLSAMESYAIDPSDPMFFKIRADLLVNAEFERRVISDRSKFGTWQAKLQGRHIGHAPFGYINDRDERGKPIIVLDPEKIDAVKEIFTRYIAGETLGEIRKKANRLGYNGKGNSALTRLLSNPVYAGLIRVPSYKKDPEKIVKGLHEPIIDEYTFYQAYERLNRNKRHMKLVVSDDLYLRGLLLCTDCGKLLTGSKSKGKGGYYFYYRCLRCSGQNHSAIRSHAQLSEIFKLLQFDMDTVKYMHDQLYKRYKERMSGSKDRIKVLQKDITHLETKIDSLEEKFIMDKVTSDTYNKWMSRLTRDLSGKKHELARLSNMSEKILFSARHKLEKLTDINGLFEKMDTLKKQEVFRFIFPHSSLKTRKGYRTHTLNELFMHNLHKFKGKELLELTGVRVEGPKTPICTRSGNRTRTASTATGF